MTIKDIAELLVFQGHDVKTRRRSDGGYIITSIDGQKYGGASGNIEARKIVGVNLSHARSYQLARIKPPKRIAPIKRKKEPLPEELVRELRKVQREWRKTHKDIGGTISVRGLRYQYENYGYDVAKASLDKSYRYTQGYAYIENVHWLIARWQEALSKAPDEDISDIQAIIELIESHAITFKEEWFQSLYYEAYYPYIQGTISIQSARQIYENTIK